MKVKNGHFFVSDATVLPVTRKQDKYTGLNWNWQARRKPPTNPLFGYPEFITTTWYEHSRDRRGSMLSLRQAISSASHWSIFLVVREKLTLTPIIYYFGGGDSAAVVVGGGDSGGTDDRSVQKFTLKQSPYRTLVWEKAVRHVSYKVLALGVQTPLHAAVEWRGV